MRTLRPLLAIAWFLLAAAAAHATDVLRVGTSGDYPPFSLAVESEIPAEENPAFEGFAPEGFDLDVAHAFAAANGLIVAPKQFRWPHLVRDFEANRFDVAMSGVTMTPERSALGRFSIPVVETGTIVLVREPARFTALETLNANSVRIGVNAGGYLERIAKATFPGATLVTIPDNSAVLAAFAAGNLDAVVSDTAEAAEWMAAVSDAALLGPLTRDRKAYWFRPENEALAASLDRWLIEQEQSGRLATLRERHFGVNAGPATAYPLLALLAGIDERLALMPLVAVAKRRAGIPLVVERREENVLDAAVESVKRASAETGDPAPPDARVRAVFRAQIEAAKQVQRSALVDSAAAWPESVPDVDRVLRPALLRIGAKIARLMITLPADLGPDEVRVAARDQLRTRWLTPESRNAIADSIAALTETASVQ